MVRDWSTMLKETCTGSTVFFWKSTFTLLDTTYLKRHRGVTKNTRVLTYVRRLLALVQQRCHKEHVCAYVCEATARTSPRLLQEKRFNETQPGTTNCTSSPTRDSAGVLRCPGAGGAPHSHTPPSTNTC